jgi:hypothetical protein
MDTEAIVNAAAMGDKEGFLQAFNAAIATKMTDALDVKKVEIASNLLGTQEEPNEVETTEVQVDGAESSVETAGSSEAT